MKAFLFDAAKCNGCYNCQVSCKDEHVDNDWGKYAAPQPDTGQFWLHLQETTHGQTPKVTVEYDVTMCMHCGDQAPCLKVAKDGAVYRRDDGLVIIDPTLAKGQKQIVEVCPYGAVYWNEALEIPQKCNGCAHLLDKGLEPRCVDACPTEALRYGEESDWQKIPGVEVLKPEYGLKPRLYYLNAFKYFVAGEIYDPALDECLSQVEVTLTNEGNKQKFTVKTDNFGDYWFKGLTPGNYSLKASKAGYADYVQSSITVSKSLRLDDITLTK